MDAAGADSFNDAGHFFGPPLKQSSFPPTACFWHSCDCAVLDRSFRGQRADRRDEAGSKTMKTISRHAMHEIRRHCREGYPDECCGVVVSSAAGPLSVIPVRNIQDEMHAADPANYPRTARTAYVGHPADLRAALDLADQPGAALFAFYHSHPDHDSYFSAEDSAQATPFGEPSYPDALQIVVSVYGRRIHQVKAFSWSPDAGAYVETNLEEA